MNEISQAVKELNRQHPAKDQSPCDVASQRSGSPMAPKSATSSASPGVKVGPSRPAKAANY